MRDGNDRVGLKSRSFLAAAILLLVLSAVFYGLPRELPANLLAPLSSFPQQVGEWRSVREFPVEKEALDLLRADDTLSRAYGHRNGDRAVTLFVAFFRSQSTGVAPHSPKNCLPGSGWSASTSDSLRIPIPGRADPIEVNRYVVSKGDAQSLVLYWYQSHQRVVASEYAAKVYLVLDTIRYRRSDTSIVRVTSSIANYDEEGAEKAAVDFIQSSFGALNEMLPH